MKHEAEDIRFDHELAKACHRCGLEVASRQAALAQVSAAGG